MKTAVIILAGGSGIRLWPLSRKSNPKQFLPVFSNNLSFFQATVSRALKIADASDIFVLTQKDYSMLVARQAPQIPNENIFFEPYKRNTAPAISTALVKIKAMLDDAVAVVLPADHYIADEDSFLSTVASATDVAAKNNKIVTIGIPPTRPDTAFGYIKCSEEYEKNVYSTECFKEKPDFTTALRFISDKNFFWNSGIFVSKLSFLIDRFRKHLPEVLSLAEQISANTDHIASDELYYAMPDISIDYGVLEKTSSVLLIKGDFGWDDIGSWNAVDRLLEKDDNGNILSGNCLATDTTDCMVFGNDKLTVTAGVENLLIINTPDATLVCPRNSTESISKITSLIEDNGYKNLL